MLEKSKYSLRNITNPKITEYIDQKFIPLDEFLWKMRLDSEEKYVPIIQRDVETMLISYLYLHKPKRILELGTAIGYSSITMVKAMKQINEDVEITTVERNLNMIELAEKNIEISGFSKDIKIIKEDALKALDILTEKIENKELELFDFIFIDAGKSHYLEFWQKIEKIVKKGGVVFCDNIFMRGMTVDSSYDIHDKHRTSIKKMRQFLDYVVGLENVATSLLPVGDGVSISYMK